MAPNSLKDEFEKASLEVKELSARPSNEQLLSLYALYKQAQIGDVQDKRPGMMDLKARKKYDSWGKLQGMAKEEAMQEYVELVHRLQNG